ncbi:GNAT family N-acetyltransferase [Streptomyces sp. NPDC057654]|uniref:GNAT family N-acetyltransferase n=1 Tax=Streptomyces sp. NPDC057654 TaxID=3346196 RepID=UPI0036B770ED
MEPVTLTTDRLILRPLTDADAEAVHAACQDPEISRWSSVPSPYTSEDAENYVGRTVPTGWQDDSLYTFGTFAAGDGALVGVVCLVRLAQLAAPEHQAEIGYWTAKEQRGRGYTVEAVREVVRWAFADLGVERLEWHAEAGNEGSRAVALKAGFQMEGTMRSKSVYAGTRRDEWVASLLPSDLGRPTETPYLPYPDRG